MSRQTDSKVTFSRVARLRCDRINVSNFQVDGGKVGDVLTKSDGTTTQWVTPEVPNAPNALEIISGPTVAQFAQPSDPYIVQVTRDGNGIDGELVVFSTDPFLSSLVKSAVFTSNGGFASTNVNYVTGPFTVSASSRTLTGSFDPTLVNIP